MVVDVNLLRQLHRRERLVDQTAGSREHSARRRVLLLAMHDPDGMAPAAWIVAKIFVRYRVDLLPCGRDEVQVHGKDGASGVEGNRHAEGVRLAVAVHSHPLREWEDRSTADGGRHDGRPDFRVRPHSTQRDGENDAERPALEEKEHQPHGHAAGTAHIHAKHGEHDHPDVRDKKDPPGFEEPLRESGKETANGKERAADQEVVK